MERLSHKVVKYQGPLLSGHYNQFFNPNICHVCKLRNNGDLISCDECGLIFYCTEVHKLMHYIQHVEVCTSVKYILPARPRDDVTRFSTRQHWIQLRKILLELAQLEFEYALKPYVTQMILWAKTCLICHQQADLRTCEECFSINYCDEHEITFYREHTRDECNRLILLLNINILTMSHRPIDVPSDFFMHFNAEVVLINMLAFIANYIRNPVSNMTSVEYVLTDYFSGPLTIYSGLDRTNLLSILRRSVQHTIHIIVAHSSKITNKKSVKAWELLFHLIPEMRTLTIVFIGPSLEFAYSNFECCFICKRNNKKLSAAYIPMSYYDYSQAPLGYEAPTIIVGFETELKEYKWWNSIKSIQTQNVPLLLCSSSEQKAKNDKVVIQNILRKPITPIFDAANYFAGVAPYRDLMTGYICKRNQHLIIYKDLQN